MQGGRQGALSFGLQTTPHCTLDALKDKAGLVEACQDRMSYCIAYTPTSISTPPGTHPWAWYLVLCMQVLLLGAPRLAQVVLQCLSCWLVLHTRARHIHSGGGGQGPAPDADFLPLPPGAAAQHSQSLRGEGAQHICRGPTIQCESDRLQTVASSGWSLMKLPGLPVTLPPGFGRGGNHQLPGRRPASRHRLRICQWRHAAAQRSCAGCRLAGAIASKAANMLLCMRQCIWRLIVALQKIC